jgi:hypothetical protein
MVRPAYLSRKSTRPLPTKDGGTLRTVLDVRNYMLGLSKDRGRQLQWQRVCELLLAEADADAFSKQVELALSGCQAGRWRHFFVRAVKPSSDQHVRESKTWHGS